MSDEKVSPKARCAAKWERDLKHHHRHVESEAVPATAITRTQLFTVASVPVTDNVQVRIPSSGGNTIPSNLGYKSIEVIINLSTADKEALGKTLALELHNASDGSFISGYPLVTPWVSYGKQITVTNPDGTTTIDPDPRVFVPLDNLSGQPVYIVYQAVGISTAGVTVNGIS